MLFGELVLSSVQMSEGCSSSAHAAAAEAGEACGESEQACGHESENLDDAAQPSGSGARERKIRKADHSLGDLNLITDLEAVTAEDMKDFPHVLKSFYTWMDVGPSKKSAKSYTLAIKRLMVSHRKTLSAMTEDEYFEFVKTSVENLQCNSLVSAALKKLCTWLSERSGGSAGPWEHRAANFEVLFCISKGLTPWGGAPLPIAPSENGLSSFFGKATKSEHACSTPPPRSRDTAPETPLKRSHTDMEQGGSYCNEGGKGRNLANASTDAPRSALTPEQLAKIQANRAAALARREAYRRATAEMKR